MYVIVVSVCSCIRLRRSRQKPRLGRPVPHVLCLQSDDTPKPLSLRRLLGRVVTTVYRLGVPPYCPFRLLSFAPLYLIPGELFFETIAFLPISPL